MDNRKTAMQELFDNLGAIDITVPTFVKQIFLEKEKQQIIDASYEFMGTNFDTNKGRAELYYNETYGGTDEI